MSKDINWTRPMLERFKKAYLEAIDKNSKLNTQHGKDTPFTFDGGDFFILYAKYLIEFLEGRLPK